MTGHFQFCPPVQLRIQTGQTRTHPFRGVRMSDVRSTKTMTELERLNLEVRGCPATDAEPSTKWQEGD
jgi:hypothetical protein